MTHAPEGFISAIKRLINAFIGLPKRIYNDDLLGGHAIKNVPVELIRSISIYLISRDSIFFKKIGEVFFKYQLFGDLIGIILVVLFYLSIIFSLIHIWSAC